MLPTMRVTPTEQIQFVSALEMRASEISVDSWEFMASDMNWTVDQVKTYSFWYFHHLTRDLHGNHEDAFHPPSGDETDGNGGDTDTNMPEEPESRNGTGSAEQEPDWSFEECVLFDNLLLRFPKEDGENSEARWRKIATMIPKKDSKSCKQRYERQFRSTVLRES